MFLNKSPDGSCNICGKNVRRLRQKYNISQRKVADMMQKEGIDIHKNAISRIESGERCVTDIELAGLAKIFCTDINELLI